MTYVPDSFTSIAAADTKVARPVSSLGLGFPATNNVNHLLGHTMGGLKCLQNCEGAASVTDPVYRIKTFRHPNCDNMGVFWYSGDVVTEASATIVCRAGAGAIQTKTYSTRDTAIGLDGDQVPWDSGDSGVQTVTITCTDVTIQSFTIFDMIRETLSSGDTRALAVDSSYASIGIEEGSFIAESDDAGVHALIQRIEDAWDNCRPQVIAWTVDDANAKTSTATSYGGAGASSDVFGGAPIKHRCRQKASETTRNTDWYVYAWCGASTTYSIQVSSSVGSDSTESTGNTNTAGSWITLADVLGATDQDDSFLVEVKRTAGTGTIYVSAVSAIEDA